MVCLTRALLLLGHQITIFNSQLSNVFSSVYFVPSSVVWSFVQKVRESQNFRWRKKKKVKEVMTESAAGIVLSW